MPTLSVFKKIIAFDDQNQTAAPKLVAVNWTRDTVVGVPVEAPSNDRFVLPSFASKNVFDGTVTLAYDNTTQFSVSLSNLSPSRYRLAWVGGTDPQFRTSRTVSVSGGSLTVVIQGNQTATVTHSAGAVFGNVQVGDDVFIPGATTGDASLFSPLNEGHWVVLAASATELTLVRETGSVFSGVAETVAVTANTQFLAYSSDGVQIDNVVGFVSGFERSLLHNYEIVEVTSTFIEFQSSAPLPTTSSVTPGASSLVIYASAKQYVYIESDQEVAISLNGLNSGVIVPFQAGNRDYPALYEITSVVYSLTVTNNSTQQASVRVISAE
jgi:hypothetical protein